MKEETRKGGQEKRYKENKRCRNWDERERCRGK